MADLLDLLRAPLGPLMLAVLGASAALYVSVLRDCWRADGVRLPVARRR